MKEKVNKKWRKKHPNQHKTYGEKRQRDEKIIEKEDENWQLIK